MRYRSCLVLGFVPCPEERQAAFVAANKKLSKMIEQIQIELQKEKENGRKNEG